jgi:hypothetical protein
MDQALFRVGAIPSGTLASRSSRSQTARRTKTGQRLEGLTLTLGDPSCCDTGGGNTGIGSRRSASAGWRRTAPLRSGTSVATTPTKVVILIPDGVARVTLGPVRISPSGSQSVPSNDRHGDGSRGLQPCGVPTQRPSREQPNRAICSLWRQHRRANDLRSVRASRHPSRRCGHTRRVSRPDLGQSDCDAEHDRWTNGCAVTSPRLIRYSLFGVVGRQRLRTAVSKAIAR